jgi:23S rRNA U2552 (ribose-2'-O)-methylase RlmE/FtsJ
VARSAFKLQEIQQKHKLIRPGGNVLDLGCHPGAWLQVACQALGPRGKGGLVLGVDIQATTAPPRYCDDRVQIVQSDARDLLPEFWAQRCPRVRSQQRRG